MKAELDKSDLVTLIKGIEPSYKIWGHFLITHAGDIKGQGDTWVWNVRVLYNRSEEQLWETYQLCKNN